MSEDKKNTPDFKISAYTHMSKYWAITIPMMDGKMAMIEADYEFLDIMPREDTNEFTSRKSRTRFFNVYGSNVRLVVGTMFAENVSPDEDKVPTALKPIFDDIDLCGNDLNMFLRQTCQNGVSDGHSFMLVTAPPKIETQSELNQSDVEGRRAYCINLAATQIPNWRYVNENGRDIATQATIKEVLMVEDGEFGEKEQIQYKVFKRGVDGANATYTVWREMKDDSGTKSTQKVPELTDVELATVEIPIVPFYTNKKGFWQSIPPYFDLAELNIDHYNLNSEFRTVMRYALPWTVVNFDSKEEAAKWTPSKFAMNNILKTWGANAKAYHIELEGRSVEHLIEEIEKDEAQMSKSSSTKFAPVQSDQQRTAYEIATDNRKELSPVTVMAKNLENAFANVVDLLIETEQSIKSKSTVNVKNPAEIKLKIDYDKLSFSLEDMKFIAQEQEAGRLSLDTYYQALDRSAIEMPTDFSAKAELEKIKAERGNDFIEQNEDIVEI